MIYKKIERRDIMRVRTEVLCKMVNIAVILGFAFLAVSSASAQLGSYGIEQRIPENANLIVMEQEGVPPADVYIDAYNMLKMQDFEITASEETLVARTLRDILKDHALVMAAKKQIDDDLAIWIKCKSETMPGGGRLISSVEYTEDVNAPISQWERASWDYDDEKARQAFFEALDILRHAAYDAISFRIGVMVEPHA
jgi:hypothetical protein